MKIYVFAMLLLLSSMVFAGQLGVYVDSNRFFGEDGKTQVEINYSFPYNAVDFMQQEYGYESEIFVDIIIQRGEKVIKSDSFTNKVIISDATKAFSDEEYLDKITLTLPNYDFKLAVKFVDVHTESSFLWEYEFEPLDIDGMLSDLEMNSIVKVDTTDYLIKFHRGDYLYQVKPNHTFRSENGYLDYYLQLRNLFEDENGKYQLEQDIIVKSGETVVDSIRNELSGDNAEIVEIQERMQISEYEDGYYELLMRYRDKITYSRAEIVDYFCINSRKSAVVRFFPELEDDVKLASYFMNTNEKNVFKTLSTDGKSNYLNKFWISQDPNQATQENEFIEEVKSRIQYANQFFSHFKPGWTTDKGRIYIKYGKPYEIRKMTTNLGEHEFSDIIDRTEQNFNSTIVRNYEIWKYRMKKNANYIFIDMLTSGEYRLIYCSDENDGEITYSNWKEYLGDDFDERLLE
ncbi:MAG: GWxTD domain-containing protein [Candidatus Cloacimonetes bacterium]|nr:GWxTD domain-containing protein [Candidatus Cloacimonadota bacterium]